MPPIKRKVTIFLLVGLLATVLIAWLIHDPSPTIEFIEFRNGQFPIPGDKSTADRIAVFRITNHADVPYSFFGYRPSSPHYLYRINYPSGWAVISPRRFGFVADTIEPHATLEIQVPAYNQDFAIGVFFERGTAEQLEAHERTRRARTPNNISRFIDDLRRRFNPNYIGPEPKWSTVAQTR